jgi:hemolysin activation/secretion protein
MFKNACLSLSGRGFIKAVCKKPVFPLAFALAFLTASQTQGTQISQTQIPSMTMSGNEDTLMSTPGYSTQSYPSAVPTYKSSRHFPGLHGKRKAGRNVVQKVIPIKIHARRHMTSSQRDARDQCALVLIDHINFEGLTAYSQETAQAIFQPLLGKPTSIKDFVKATEQLVHKYWDDGYVLAEAEIKFQEFHTSNREATIHIHEGQIKQTSLVGGDEGVQALLLNYINLVQGTHPFNMEAFEEYNGLMNYIPGLTVKGQIRPVDNDGDGHLEVTATQKRFIPYFSFDNRGSKFVGPYRAIVGAYGISLFKKADVGNATFMFTPHTKELKYGRLSYVFPLNYHGDSLSVRADYGKTEPGYIVKSRNITSHTSSFEVLYQHLNFAIPHHQIALKAGFEASASDSVTPTSRIYADQTRELILGIGDTFIDRTGGRNLTELRLYQGFLELGATNRPPSFRSEPDGKANNTRLLGEWIHAHPLPKRFSFVARVRGQYSFQPTLAHTAFYFGSYPYGSAYDPGELSGDHGLAGRLEGRYAFKTYGKFLNKAQTYLFYDAGKVWNRNISSGYKAKSGTSAGVGVRFLLCKNYEADFEVAKPLTMNLRSTLANGTTKPVRFFFKLTARF